MKLTSTVFALILRRHAVDLDRVDAAQSDQSERPEGPWHYDVVPWERRSKRAAAAILNPGSGFSRAAVAAKPPKY